jgi:hypothetical protein
MTVRTDSYDVNILIADVEELKASRLAYEGDVTSVSDTTHFAATALAGMGDDFFASSNPWYAYVVWDADGAGAAPQGESQPVSAYDSATGAFTHTAFTAPLVATDTVLLLHPDVANASSARDRTRCMIVKWSAPEPLVQLSNSGPPGTDVALPSVVVADIPAGATVTAAYALFKYRIIQNTNANANKLQDAQSIQVKESVSGTYTDAIDFEDNDFSVPASTTEGGDVIIGANNLSAEVTGNATYSFQWTAALVDYATMDFKTVQTGLQIWYSI